jgi:hypothetical protein
MPFELLHFRNAEKILADMNMEEDLKNTLDYLDTVLYGTGHSATLLKEALKDMGWRGNGTLNILEGRRYQYKGFKNRVAIEGFIGAYEIIHDGLFRLQLGYEKGKLDVGVMLINGLRSIDSPFGTTRELVQWEVTELEPTILVPVAIAVFDVGLEIVSQAKRLK